jgi:hypothetical protein
LLEKSLVALLQGDLLGLKNFSGRLIHNINHLAKLLNISEWQKLDEKFADTWGTEVAHVWYQLECHR